MDSTPDKRVFQYTFYLGPFISFEVINTSKSSLDKI